MADASPRERLARMLGFYWRAFVRGLGLLHAAYQTLIAAITFAVVVLGVSLPPIIDLAPLRLTLPFGVVVLLIVVARGTYRMWDDVQRRLAPVTQPLESRYTQSEPYRHAMADMPWVAGHRVGIFNPAGHQAARRVRVHLVDLQPRPRKTLGMDPVIPYVVPLRSGGDASVGITLGPGQEELWKIGYTATGSDGTLNAGGFAVPDQKWRGLPWEIDPDARLRFGYEIVWEGSAPVPFSIVLYADGTLLRCQLEG